jgi:hypothetical protein
MSNWLDDFVRQIGGLRFYSAAVAIGAPLFLVLASVVLDPKTDSSGHGGGALFGGILFLAIVLLGAIVALSFAFDLLVVLPIERLRFGGHRTSTRQGVRYFEFAALVALAATYALFVARFIRPGP